MDLLTQKTNFIDLLRLALFSFNLDKNISYAWSIFVMPDWNIGSCVLDDLWIFFNTDCVEDFSPNGIKYTWQQSYN